MKLYNCSSLLLHLRNLDIQSIDVKIAYLYGNLDEKIYIEQLEGFRLSYPGSTQWLSQYLP